MKPYWKRQAGTASPDYEGHGATLRERTNFAIEAIEAYSHSEVEYDELRDWITDLIADMMHLCDREDWRFQDILKEAQTKYMKQTNEQE